MGTLFMLTALGIGDNNPENWEMSLDEFEGVVDPNNPHIDPDLIDDSEEGQVDDGLELIFNLTSVDGVVVVAKDDRFLALATFILSLLLATFWIMYIIFYHSRVVGLIITKILNSFVIKEGYVRLGSISISVLSGKIMFRDIIYVTEDQSLRIQDGWMIFRWWKEYQPKNDDVLDDMANTDTRLSILLNGYEYHRYNHSKAYSRLERLFGLESFIFPEYCGGNMPEDESCPQNNNVVKDKPPSKEFSWRDLIPVIKVEICHSRLDFGNSLVPYTLAMVMEEAHLIYTTRAATCSLDKFTHVIQGRTENFKMVLSQSPKYTGLKDEPPRLMGEGFELVNSQKMKFSHYVDEPGIAPSQPEIIQLDNGDFMEATPPSSRMEVYYEKGTHFNYGPWADRQRDLLFKLFYPQDYQEKKPTPKPMPGERRQIQSFDIIVNITEATTAAVLFQTDNNTKVIHMDIGAGSHVEMNIPLITQSEGYTTNMTGQLLQLKTSTSLQYRSLMESEMFQFKIQCHFPIHWNEHQEWCFDLTGYKTSVSFTYAHRWFFQDLINDWASRSPPDILYFVPYTWKINLCLDEFEIMTPVNEYNWIDCSGMDQENNMLAATGETLNLSFDLPSEEFLPESILFKFKIHIQDGCVNFFVPQASTAFVALKGLETSAKIRKVNGSVIPLHGNWTNGQNTRNDTGAGNQWKKCQQSNQWVECWSVPSCKIGVNFTYHPMPPLGPTPHADMTTSEIEKGLLSPIRLPGQTGPLKNETSPYSDFDPTSLPADQVHVEVEVEPSIILLYGSFLKLILNLKENIFGDNQNFVDMSADNIQLSSRMDTGIPGFSTTGDKIDFRKYRPLEVTVLAILHDIQGHLLKNSTNNDPPCPTIFIERAGFEMKKGFRETQLQVLISSIKVFVTDNVTRSNPEDKHLGEGYMSLKGLQVRGHCMFSNEGRSLEQDTLEYAFLIELQLGRLSGRLTTPHLETILSAAQCFLLPALDEENILRPPQPFFYCQHGNNQFECVEQNSFKTGKERGSGDICPTSEEIKYKMIRVSVDAVDVYVVEENTALSLLMSPIRIANCNLHGRVMREGFTLLVSDVQLRQLVMVNPAFTRRLRFSEPSVLHSSRETITVGQSHTGSNQTNSTSWLEAGTVILGPVCLEIALKGRGKREEQYKFLSNHDNKTKRLWFLWKMDNGLEKKCACTGGTVFFGRNVGGSTFLWPSKKDIDDGVNVAYFRVNQENMDPGFGQSILEPAKLIFDTKSDDDKTKNPKQGDKQSKAVSKEPARRKLPSLSTRRSRFSETKMGPVEKQERDIDIEGRQYRHSFYENQQMLNKYLRQGESEERLLDGSYDSLSLDSLSDLRLSYHEEESMVNLQMHTNKPIMDSSLLMPCYMSHLTQLKCENWHGNAPTGHSSETGSVQMNDEKVMHGPDFQRLADGFSNLAMINRSINLTQRSGVDTSEVNDGAVRDEVDNDYFYRKLMHDGWRETEGDTADSTSTNNECITFVFRAQNDLNIMASPLLLEGLQKFMEAITPTLRSLHPLTVVNNLHEACISSVENANLLKKEKSLLLLRNQNDAVVEQSTLKPRLLEQVSQNTIQGSISFPKINIKLLQASVVEEVIAFSALDNIRDLMCVSILAVGVESTQVNFLFKKQEKRTVQIFHSSVIPAMDGKKRRSKLSTDITSEPILIEQSEKQNELLTASIDVSKMHTQLRRLKNDCGILQEAVITAIPGQRSKVFFKFKKIPKSSPTLSGTNEKDGKFQRQDSSNETCFDEKVGFIMWECGLEGISLQGMKHSDNQRKNSSTSLTEDGNVSVTLCNELSNTAGSERARQQRGDQSPIEDEKPRDEKSTPKNDASNASCAVKLKEMWYNFAAPPKTSLLRKIDYTRVDWNLVSTASTAINAWLNPINHLKLAVKSMQHGYARRTNGLLASLMAETLDLQSIHQHKSSKFSKLTPLAKTLKEDPSCRLCNVLRRYIAETDMEKIERNVTESELPQLSTLRQGVIVLSRQWKNVLYTPLPLEHNLQSNSRKSRNVTVIYKFPQNDTSDGGFVEVAIDEDIALVEMGRSVSPDIETPEGTIEDDDHGSTKEYEDPIGRPRSSFEHGDEESLLLGAHTKFSQHPSLTLVDAHVIFKPLLTTMGLMPHQIMGYSFDNLGTHLSTMAAVEVLRVDIVKSETQGFGPSSKSEVRFVFSTPSEAPPIFLCEKISLEIDFKKNPDMNKDIDVIYQTRNYWKKQAKSAVIFSANIDSLSHQVNMPLLRLIHQITNMYQNVTEAKAELKKQKSLMASTNELLEPETPITPTAVISTFGEDQIHNSNGSVEDHEIVPSTPITPIPETNPPALPKRTQSFAKRISALRHKLISERSKNSRLLQRPQVLVNPPPNCWRNIEYLISLYASRPETKMVVNRKPLSSPSFNKNAAVPSSTARDVLDHVEKGQIYQEPMSQQSTLEKRKEPPEEPPNISIFGIARIRKTKLLASLSGLKLEAEILNLQASCSFKKKERSAAVESSITGHVGESVIGLLEGAAPNQKTVVTISISKSGGLYTTVNTGKTTTNSALLSVGPINIDIPQHPLILHGMMTRSTKRISSTLHEFRVRRFSRGSSVEEVDLPSHLGDQVDSAISHKSQDPLQSKVNVSEAPPHLQIQFTVVVESLGITTALLPSLRAQYKMEMVKSCGITGNKTNFQISLPAHTLSFESHVSDGSTLPGAASISLPKIDVVAEYIQDDPTILKESIRTTSKSGVPPQSRSYISAKAEIAALEHTLTTDLLNHLVFIQKVFMKEINDVILKVSGGGDQPVPLRKTSKNTGSALPIFALVVRLQGIQITATTPTDIAVRLETGILKFKMSNRDKSNPRNEHMDQANKVFIKSEMDVSVSLGQLIRNAVFEEADSELHQYAFFKTRIGLRNVTDMNTNASSGTPLGPKELDKKVVLIKLTRPLINIQPVAVDKAILMWLNYKNAYEYWTEQRSGLKTEARQGIDVTNPSNQSGGPPYPAKPRATDTKSSSSTLFLQLDVDDLGISVPLNPNLQLSKMDAESRGAIVVTLRNTSISACSSGSLVSKGKFTELCMRFTEDVVTMDDWKPNLIDPTIMNICVVSEGTYEVCSRTTSGNTLEGKNAKLFLNVQWQMEGVDIHLDPNIGKQLSTLGHTLTTLTVFKEEDEMDDNESSEDVLDCPGVGVATGHQLKASHFTFEPDVVLRKQATIQIQENIPAFLTDPNLSPDQRRSLLGKEMQEKVSLINELSRSGSPSAEIEEEKKKLQELENVAFRDFWKDLIKKLRRQSTVKPDRERKGFAQRSKSLAVPIPDQGQMEWRQYSLDSKSALFPKTKEDFARLWLQKVRGKMSSTHVDETGGLRKRTNETRRFEAPGSPMNLTNPQEPNVDFELDVKVFINRGKCVLHTKAKEEKENTSRKRRPSGYDSLFNLNSPTHPLFNKGKQYLSANRLKPPYGVIGGSVTDTTIFYIPGLDVKTHYDSHTICVGRQSGIKRASMFASITLHSVPETIIGPHILDFMEQNLEMMPVVQPSDRISNPKQDEGDNPSGEDVASDTFPVDVIVYFHMQPSTFRFTCQPVSRVECMLRLPAVDIVYSSQRGEDEQRRSSTQDSRPKLRRTGVVGLSGLRDLPSSPVGPGPTSSVNKGFSITGCLSDFSLFIFHPYGAAARKDKWSPLNDNERRDSVSINVEFIKFHLSRSRRVQWMTSSTMTSYHPTAIHFSTIVDVGSASFKYDMRRLTEILAFPKAWYRRSLVRRVLLGDLSANTGVDAVSSRESFTIPIRKNSTRRRSPSFRQRNGLGTIQESPKPSGSSLPNWETRVLFTINFTKLNIQMNMGNVMGNVGWLIRNIASEGKLSTDSTGNKNLYVDVGLHSSYIEAKGGIVAGTLDLATLKTHLKIQQDPRVEPHHIVGLNLNGLELRVDFMGTNVLMGRISGLALNFKDEWLVQPKENPQHDTLATYRPATIFIHGDMEWDQLQLMISKSTTVDLHKIQCKLEEFFSQQFKSGKWVLGSMYRDASSNLTPNTKRRIEHNNKDGIKDCFQPHDHRHWQNVLKKVSLISISPTLATFPETGTVLGGNMKLYGNNISLACFHGINFKAKSWALFSLKEPFISFSTEAQEINSQKDASSDSTTIHVVQNLNLRLGQQDNYGANFYGVQSESMAMISRITRNVMYPPQFRTLHEWFHYAFAPSEIDDVARFPSLERERENSFGSEQRHVPVYLPDPNHNKEVIFALPRLELFFKTEQSQPFSRTLVEGRPVVNCSFVTEFEDHIHVCVDADAFLFLHDLITSYIKEKDKLMNAQLALGPSQSPTAERSSPSPTFGNPMQFQRDLRDYQCGTWQLEPTVRLLSWAGKSIEPYGMDYILHKLGFSHARVTIPKWMQRGCCDTLDEILSLLILRMVDLAKQESSNKA